jgi:hypothetical protein
MNVKREDELTKRAAELATGIQPSRDLWPGIEAAISEPAGGRSWFSPYLAQAAAVVLLVGASSGLTWLVMQDEAQPVQVAVAPDLVFQQASFARYELGPGFQDARSRLRSQLEDELAKLSPESREEVESNLDTIRAAIAEINEALEAEPDNTLLQELLLRTYRDELTVMRRVGGLTQDVTTRNNGYRNDI